MRKLPTRKDFAHDYPNVGFDRRAHHVALEKWAEEANERLKKLEHHETTTVGLWATDRPDLVEDAKKIMFQITGA